MGEEVAGSPPAQGPLFVAEALRTSAAELVKVVPAGEHVDLWFGTCVPSEHCPGATGAAPSVRIRLDHGAARHLEEVLTRVLGAATPKGEGSQAR